MYDMARRWSVRRSEEGDVFTLRALTCGEPEVVSWLASHAPIILLCWLLGGWLWGLGALAVSALVMRSNHVEYRVDSCGLHVTERGLFMGLFPVIERVHLPLDVRVSLYREPFEDRVEGLVLRSARWSYSNESGLLVMPVSGARGEVLEAVLTEELERARRTPSFV